MHNIENDKWFLEQVNKGVLTVFKNGKIFNNKTNRFIGTLGSGRYPKISLTKEKVNGKWIICHMQIHRLVWIVYCGLVPEGLEVNHKDANKLNPDFDNLELLPPKENIIHALNAGLMHIFELGNKEHAKRKSYGNRYMKNIQIL